VREGRVSYPAVVGVCGACGTGYEGSPKFCSECAAPLGAPRVVAEERKVVTALFCDLVGFTALSESADPEDVDRMLTRYFAMARSAIEAFGGVVEKFIGDAVVGVFGVPAAHEDDPERAVRAGLRIAEHAESLTSLDGGPLQLRVGINTGETLVRLGVVPGSGERFLAGDAINTASRIQSVAPLMGVAVGQSTYDVTRAVFDYAELPPATLKGKSELVPVFHAVSPRARLGTDVTRVHDGPFVGREIDLALLRGVFDKTVAASSVQLVTVVGEPGMGKSRLVAELSRYVDARPELVTWRQGRCLPYGEGITFWALSEVVKAHAGILDSDDAEVAADKLEAVLPDTQRAWYRQRLLPLIGVAASSIAEREELFAAWTGFLEHVADDGPTVVVLEDLHWADEPMLDFLEHLADHAEGVPLLVVGTARPELFEHHASYGSGLRNATSISLAPLSDDETSRLISGLLEAVAVPAEVQAGVLERAGGNPLFAEEYLRLLRDRGLLVQTGTSWTLTQDAEVPLPSTVQALIAARIDTLTPDGKALVADAAVIGKVFWDGALAVMSGRGGDIVAAALRELTRKQLIRPARRSSVADQLEYAFWHVLTRDVAYAQLPRAARATKHLAAADWIEQTSVDRVEDVADVLAFHATTALDAAIAAQDDIQAAHARALAFRYLTLAGERAHGLDTATALASLERALELAPDDDLAIADARLRFAWIAFEAGRYRDSTAAFEQAAAAFESAGQTVRQAEALVGLSRVLGRTGDPRTWTLPEQAYDLVAALPPGPVHVAALAEMCVIETLNGDGATAVALADRALTLADDLGLPPPTRAIAFRGGARCRMGDAGGLNDHRRAIELADAAGAGADVAKYYNNYGIDSGTLAGPRVMLEVISTGVDYARERGLGEAADCAQVNLLDGLVLVGRPDEAVELAATLSQRFEASGNLFDLNVARQNVLWVSVVRGRIDGVEELARSLEVQVSEMGQADLEGQVSAVLAAYSTLTGDRERARNFVRRLVDDLAPAADWWFGLLLPLVTRTQLALGDIDGAADLLGTVRPDDPLTIRARASSRAALAEAVDNVAQAVDDYLVALRGWEEFDNLLEQGYALLGLGRCRLRLGQVDEARDDLARARDVFAIYDAAPALREIDDLLHSSALGA